MIQALVSIAIICILCALLITTISGIRERAESLRCVANLRTLYLATLAYGVDNQGEVPVDRDNNLTGLSWYKGILDYVPGVTYGAKKSPFKCPSNPVGNEIKGAGHNDWTNYAINYNLYKGGTNLGSASGAENSGEFKAGRSARHLSHFSPHRILYIDSFNGESKSDYTVRHDQWVKNWNNTHAVHKDRVNVVFLDGHIEQPRVSPREVNSTGDLMELKVSWFYEPGDPE